MAIRIPQTIAWKNGRLKLIDQTQLPNKLAYEYCDTVEEVWNAIKQLKVRGAPAIGVAAGYGIIVALKKSKAKNSDELIRDVDKAAATSPVAAALFWLGTLLWRKLGWPDGGIDPLPLEFSAEFLVRLRRHVSGDRRLCDGVVAG